MNDEFATSIVTVLMAIIGVAIIAILISPKAQTSAVLTSGGKAFSQILGAAISPVTGESLGSVIGSFA